MAGSLVGGNGSESPDRALHLTLHQWQAGSAVDAAGAATSQHSLQVMGPQCMAPSNVAQCLPPLRTDSLASQSALAVEEHAHAVTLNQEIEGTEEKLRIELRHLRGGAGQVIDSAFSASASEKNELQDTSSALSGEDGHSRRSNLSTRQSVSTLEGQELQSIRVELVRSERLSPTMEYVSALAHLTTFGILGVCIRYGLRILFFQNANVTMEDSPLLTDLPANMVGCFFMGWVGIVLKKDIAAISELLAIGLSTGLMGSITTYSSWNQAMIVLVTKGLWVRSIVSLIIGMELSQMSLVVGIDSAKLLRSGMRYMRGDRGFGGWRKQWGPSPDNLRRRKIGMLVFMASSTILWAASLILTVIDVDNAVRRRLWLACVVGPPGVWARWHLARLNGQGIGRNQYLKWLPVGTLLTNVVASILQAVLAVVLLASPEDASLLCKGLQTGLLGCMSTVSTFVTEVYSLHQGSKRWRAYAYFCIMLFCTYSMGVLVYTLPVLAHPFPL